MSVKKPKATKFQDGDIVRCIKSHGGGYTTGGAYEVKNTYLYGSEERIHTVIDDNGSATNGWGVRNFELLDPPKKKALNSQVGGTHYTDMAIQPAHYNLANKIGWAEGDAISYISRWRAKGGLQDLRKARQTLLLLIEHEEALGTK
jgi:hypothetical protein